MTAVGNVDLVAADRLSFAQLLTPQQLSEVAATVAAAREQGCTLGEEKGRREALAAIDCDGLARWLFDRDYRERSLASPSDAAWDGWVERNQDQWRAEARAVVEHLRAAT